MGNEKHPGCRPTYSTVLCVQVCRLPGADMRMVLALVALALLAVLVGSAWARRAEWDVNGEASTMLLGLGFCIVAVGMILVALGML